MNKSNAQKMADRESAYQSNLTPFQKWFTVFLEEKSIDMSEPVTAGDGSTLKLGDVCTAIMNAIPGEQKAIKSTLVMIDFRNASVEHYLRHLAKALNVKDKVGI